VGSMRHWGPLGSDPGKEMAWVSFMRRVGPGINVVLADAEKTARDTFLIFKFLFIFDYLPQLLY
jgi:hypothetical protein